MRNTYSIIEQLKDIIKQKGMKYTEQREIILQILVELDDHHNAEEIHRIIQEKYPEQKIGIATVYRTLNFLEEVQLISSIPFGKDGKKYESKPNEHHDHMICTNCGKIIEFLDDNTVKIEANHPSEESHFLWNIWIYDEYGDLVYEEFFKPWEPAYLEYDISDLDEYEIRTQCSLHW